MSNWDKLLLEIVLVSRMLDKIVIILDEESPRACRAKMWYSCSIPVLACSS